MQCSRLAPVMSSRTSGIVPAKPMRGLRPWEYLLCIRCGIEISKGSNRKRALCADCITDPMFK